MHFGTYENSASSSLSHCPFSIYLIRTFPFDCILSLVPWHFLRFLDGGGVLFLGGVVWQGGNLPVTCFV